MVEAGENTKPLRGTQVLTLAVNVPGPAATARLCKLGATVIKVEPPEGDPLARANPDWYEALVSGQQVIQLNLEETDDRARLDNSSGRVISCLPPPVPPLRVSVLAGRSCTSATHGFRIRPSWVIPPRRTTSRATTSLI